LKPPQIHFSTSPSTFIILINFINILLIYNEEKPSDADIFFSGHLCVQWSLSINELYSIDGT
jgi:hypothetical protein